MATLSLEDMCTRLGLPKHSAQVYMLLETEGYLLVSAVAQQLTIHRPAVYRALRALEKAGLVAVRKSGKRRVYGAQERKRIETLFAGALRDVSRVVEQGECAPEAGNDESVRVLHGTNSVAAVFEDVLAHSKRGGVFFRYTSERSLDAVNKLLPPDYRKRRDAKRLERLVISNRASGTQKRSRLERFIRYLGTEQEPFDQNVIQLVYGDRVALIDLGTQQAYIIKNAAIADFHATIFRNLYRRL